VQTFFFGFLVLSVFGIGIISLLGSIYFNSTSLSGYLFGSRGVFFEGRCFGLVHHSEGVWELYGRYIGFGEFFFHFDYRMATAYEGTHTHHTFMRIGFWVFRFATWINLKSLELKLRPHKSSVRRLRFVRNATDRTK
jgi:hypothetical protein